MHSPDRHRRVGHYRPNATSPRIAAGTAATAFARYLAPARALDPAAFRLRSPGLEGVQPRRAAGRFELRELSVRSFDERIEVHVGETLAEPREVSEVGPENLLPLDS